MSNEKQVFPVTKTSETIQNCCFSFFKQELIYRCQIKTLAQIQSKTFDQSECLVTYYFYYNIYSKINN